MNLEKPLIESRLTEDKSFKITVQGGQDKLVLCFVDLYEDRHMDLVFTSADIINIVLELMMIGLTKTGWAEKLDYEIWGTTFAKGN